MRYYLLILSALLLHPALAQDKPAPPVRQKDTAGLRAAELARKNKPATPGEAITIRDYKIISNNRDTTFLDTTLTIQKEYRYNYLRRDDFELMPFSNVGQPYNRLGANLNRESIFPRMGARARHFNYLEVADIRYYNVATPMTDLFFKTTFEQGQLLDAMLTSNFNRRLNFSIAFKGFRSLGKYRQDEAQSGNFRATANYVTRDGRYRFMAHVAAQDIRGQENGGLLNAEDQFESENPDFQDRSRIDVRFSNVQNELNGKRYYLDHEFRLLGRGADSIPGMGNLYLTHRFAYETKWYQYSQNNNSSGYFGDLILTPVKDQAYLKTFYNRMGTGLENRWLGRLEGFVTVYDYTYFFNSILQSDAGTIPNKLSGQELVTGASWEKSFGSLRLEAEGGLGLGGDLTDSYLDASVTLPLGESFELTAGIHHSARKPDFNFLLYQSDYLNYNWDNSGTFENEQVQSLFGRVRSDLLGTLSAQFSSSDNYSYFASIADAEQVAAGEEQSFVRPFQQAGRINHLRVRYEKEFRLGKWALNNTLLYQEVDQDAAVLNVPQLLTRNTLYFSSDVFKKAMFVQTGITLKYFTPYFMDAYNPLLGDFYVQDREEFGGFPMLDFFINAKVRQTRIYLKAEHFNSSFTGNSFYSAPNYPYRDFVIRFGLVWNFFS
ncbi:putative porin [Robiginitalea sp. SC105]|uniref:putative porin n=1 Tax=Robiginitalea sp. SC105 TaxID=2762332 RepID=UPI00163A6F3B|nr:putative porin [Robiginitalea sp. SC105]MBC2837698.1 putative porin [Robiginitalea sp. SC105]